MRVPEGLLRTCHTVFCCIAFSLTVCTSSIFQVQITTTQQRPPWWRLYEWTNPTKMHGTVQRGTTQYNAVQSCLVCPRPNCVPFRYRKVSPRIRKHQTSGERDLLLSPIRKLDPLFARVRQLGLALLEAKIVPMQHMTHPWGDTYSMCFQEAQLKLSRFGQIMIRPEIT